MFKKLTIYITLLNALFVLPCVFALNSSSENSQAPTIQSIEVEFIGTHEKVSEASILGQLRLREGMMFDQRLADQSIHSLYQSGHYDFIEILKEPIGMDKVMLIVRVQPAYRVQSIRFEGNKRYKDKKLSKEIKTTVNTALDRALLADDALSLSKFYQKFGYANVLVDLDVQEFDSTGNADVVFKIDEGHKIKISKILFFGNESISDDDLLDEMKTKRRRFYSFLTGSGRFHEDEFDADLKRIKSYYKNNGFLDVAIPMDGVIFEYPSPGSMIIEINIEEGKQYRVGTVSLAGNTIYTNEELLDLIELCPEDIASPKLINESSEAIRDYYGSFGYLDTYVYAERIPNVTTGDIDVVFHVNESAKFYLESIEIEGNLKTKNRVILRELALEPGDVFNLVRMKRSRRRLEGTRFFDEVDVAPVPSNIPGRRNMRVTVKEARTANLSFGAGFSTLERWSIFTEFTQSNFDLFNYRNGFQGGGQKFRIKGSLGTRAKEIVIGFEEPWLFERPLTLGVDLYHTRTNYVSSAYNEVRTGLDVYLSKYLFELVVGRLSYKVEQVNITDVGAGTPIQVQNEKGEKIVSKLGLNFVRDTRNNLFMPTNGSRFAFINELAGGPLGGESDYYKVEGHAAVWLPTFKTATQVFSIAGRTGTIVGFNNKSVPFFDRYFLGGPNSIRGFNFRGVGPKGAGNEPTGGNTYGFLTTEYSVELMEPIRFAVFYDIGFVANDTGHWDIGSYNDSWGIGLRIPLMGAPIRLDFAFPLRGDGKNDNGNQFHFTFGTVF